MAFAIPNWLADLAYPINYTFSGASYRLVPFFEESGQNWEVLHRILRGFRVGFTIKNVDWWMPGKILLQRCPCPGHDAVASVETGDRSTEHKTRKRKRCGVPTGRAPVSL